MDFDPNAGTREKPRSGPRWYSVVAFLVIAFLMAANALAMFANAEANEEQACYAKYNAGIQMVQARAGELQLPGKELADIYTKLVTECSGGDK